MMDFMDNLRRGVDRAGFEVDKLLRANRARAQVAALRSQMDEELRQIGRLVMELCDRDETVPDVLKESCSKVRRYEMDVAAREIELERINDENPPDLDKEATAVAPVLRCSACGVAFSPGAKFCANCGAKLVSSGDAEGIPTEKPGPTTESGISSVESS
ncbi:MAG TPA: zinc ribbon domain-containing protein [Chloroflexota bacterium]